MAFHNLTHELPIPHYSDQQLGESTAATGGGVGNTGPTWLNSAILRQQNPGSSFLHLQSTSDSMIAAAMSHAAAGDLDDGEKKSGDGSSGSNGNGGEKGGEGNGRYKAEILSHPLYEQLLSAHVACLRIATPVDQLPRIDAQLAQSQQVVAKYSVLANHPMIVPDDKELSQFMVGFNFVLC